MAYLLSFFAAGALPPSAAAQQLAGYWQALEQASSAAELTPPVAASDSAVAHGLYLLRRYELERDRTDAFLAKSRLDRVLEREPRHAWAHFAVGALLARGPDVRVALGDDASAYVTWQQSNAVLNAPRHLRKALQLDPTLHEAAFVLARFALDQGNRELMGEVVRELERAGRDTMVRALGLRAELMLALGDGKRSALLADSAAARGSDVAVAAHQKAAALLPLAGREVEGMDAYFDGIARLTPAGAAVYFDAVGALATPRQVGEWRTADLEARRAWLRRFWDVEAALAGVPLEERLAEHFRRLAEVRRNGRVAPMGAGAAIGAFDVREFGVPTMKLLTLLRHGDEERVRKVMFCGPDVLEQPLPLQPTADECRRSPRGRNRLVTRLTSFQAQDRASAGTSYYPDFEQHLVLAYDVLQFRAAGGATQVVAAVGVPAASTRALRSADRLIARTELALIDTAAAVVQRQQEIRRFAAGPLPEGGWMLLHTALHTRRFTPHAFRISVTDMAREAGAIVGGDVGIRNYGTGELTLSDVVLSPLDGAPSFARGAQRISLAPGREFRRSESLALYYEVYGIERGGAYRTEIAIDPQPDGILARMRSLFPGAPETLRLSFAEEAGTVHQVYGVQQLRTVGLDGLLPGRYRLTVKVIAADGRSGTRECMLFVAGDAR